MVANNSQCGEAEFAVKIKCFLIYERMAQTDCKSLQIYYKTQSLCLYFSDKDVQIYLDCQIESRRLYGAAEECLLWVKKRQLLFI